MPSYVTRRVTFAAAHRYRVPQWSEAENERVFGLCARPSFHGHSYTCDVTVTGEVDQLTGFVVDLGALDRLLEAEVRDRFDHRNINVDIPEFADGKLVPTGENLARFVFDRLKAALAQSSPSVGLVSVTIAEDSSLSATYRPD